MFRRLAMAVLILAVAVLGYQPGAVRAMASFAVAAEQPCCPDCDQPAPQDDQGCGKQVGCTYSCGSSVPLYAPTSRPVLVLMAFGKAWLWPDHSLAASADVAPPFRPPRLLILA